MELENNFVRPKKDAFQIITDRFSFYAANEHSGNLSKHLTDACASLNKLLAFYGKNNIVIKDWENVPTGIVFVNFSYKPDISFVRNLECKPKRLKENLRTIRDTD